MATTDKPRAKAKVVIAHGKAISEWQQWLADHLDATHEEKMKMFNYFVDKNAA